MGRELRDGKLELWNEGRTGRKGRRGEEEGEKKRGWVRLMEKRDGRVR